MLQIHSFRYAKKPFADKKPMLQIYLFLYTKDLLKYKNNRRIFYYV